jgi:hypothetical protein
MEIGDQILNSLNSKQGSPEVSWGDDEPVKL